MYSAMVSSSQSCGRVSGDSRRECSGTQQKDSGNSSAGAAARATFSHRSSYHSGGQGFQKVGRKGSRTLWLATEPL